MTWSRHLFLFYFERANKIKNKTLIVTLYFVRGDLRKIKCGLEGQVTYQKGT